MIPKDIDQMYLDFLSTLLTKGGIFMHPLDDWYVVQDTSLSATETVRLLFQLSDKGITIEARFKGVHGDGTYITGIHKDGKDHFSSVWSGNTFQDCCTVENAYIYSSSRLHEWHSLAYGLARPLSSEV